MTDGKYKDLPLNTGTPQMQRSVCTWAIRARTVLGPYAGAITHSELLEALASDELTKALADWVGLRRSP